MKEFPSAMPEDLADEQLVAYLDGELEAEEVERVEQRLASDEHFRRRMQLLQRSWDLLDDLPRAEASESFTQSTVSVVALKAVDSQSFWQRHRTALVASLASLATIAAALLGYLAVYSWFDRPNQLLLRDLPVIEKVDMYTAISGIDFLRELDEQQVFEGFSENEEITRAP